MIIDGSRGWYWYLKSLPEKSMEFPIIRFNVIVREIGSRFNAKSMMIDESMIAYDVRDSDTLLGILFEESLKSMCIAALDESGGYSTGLHITIVLVQGKEGCTNINADVMDSFAKVFQQPH